MLSILGTVLVVIGILGMFGIFGFGIAVSVLLAFAGILLLAADRGYIRR